MPERRFDLFAFDWDGTCMDTTRFIALAIQDAARAMGLPVPTFAAASSVIGLGHAEMLRIAVPSCPVSGYDRFAEEYWKAYIGREQTISGLHEGLEDLLSRMCGAGLILAVATGKSRKGLDRVFGRTGAGKYFRATRTASEAESKPSPDMLLQLSRELGVPPSRMVMIGDAVHDVGMALNAGAASVAVTWGAASREELEESGCRAVVDTVPELAAALGIGDLLL